MASKAILAPDVNDNKPEEVTPEEYIPEGYDSVRAFLDYAMALYKADAEYDKDNRDMALDDLEFIGGKIWDPEVEAAREGRPCPIINNLPQFIGQVIGDRRINKTAIKVRPLKGGTAEIALVRAGIIKGIEYKSRAERAYDLSLENQVSCGIGNMRAYLDWADEDAFEQDIFIGNIPNPLAVVWDFMSHDPTGRDAQHCFVQDNVTTEQFEKTWPDATPDNAMIEELGLTNEGWFANNVVRVTEFWEMKTRVKTVALAPNGEVIDITGQDIEELVAANRVAIHPVHGEPITREANVPYACMHLITGSAILAGPYELPINRLPIVRVEGRIVNIGDDRYRYSLVRWQKDPIRNKCYMRAVQIEELAMAPKVYWMAEDAAVAGYEDDYTNAHLSQTNLLKYKQGQKKPDRIDPPAMNAAAIHLERIAAQDMKDVAGIHDASLGIQSNEVSGRAINARKVEGDVATVMYHDNHNAAIQEIGDVVNQLIDVAYDTARQLLYIGEDDKEKVVEINNPMNPDSVDISKGKYGVAIETGPSFTTQRVEGAQAMMEMIKVAPDIMGLAADLIAKYQDFPGALEIAERLKKAMKAKGIDVGDEEQQGQQIPPEMVEQIKQSVMAEFMQTAQGQQLQLELKKAAAEAREAEANADKAEAEAEKAEVEAEAHGVKIASEVLSKAKPEQPRQNNSNRSGSRRKPAQKKPKGNTK